MDRARLRPLLRLLLTPGMHSAAAIRLLRAFGDDPERVLAAPRSALQTIAGLGPGLPCTVSSDPGTPEEAAREEARARDLAIALVGPGDEGWPEPLVDLYDPPPLLWIRGGWTRRDILAVSVVGSRRATAYGERHAGRIAKGLAQRGVTIVSGLAVGIDSAAHAAALEVEGGRTLAVLGCGHADPYQDNRRAFRDRIAGHGAVISDLPLDFHPSKQTFPRRNRIIAALGRGTVVVEGAGQSGTLITANHALDIGRLVMGVPGDIEASNRSGVHGLLRQGAAPVETAEQVLEALGLEELLSLPVTVLRPPESGPGRRIWDALDRGASLDPDALVRATGLPTGAVRAALVDLELEGLVRPGDGGRYARA